jgi:hypothetical protein
MERRGREKVKHGDRNHRRSAVGLDDEQGIEGETGSLRLGGVG